VSHRRTEDG